MNITKMLGSLLLASFVCACSPKQPEQQPAQLPEKKSQGVLTDSQQQTLDKAKQTEELLDKTNKERMKEVDEAAGEK
ncbi:hypothetical protein GCM10011613_11790 [Cellvibrio zantedeschiae]|uniref:Lipoprotein n=1 Tax=Cellvibrio zantedeschiae TaxID=1237077 RepID=A0ABQ3AZT2_9GAMM|nr:hypothetical protein [Cellvibrio zantedeschiae]GGY69118.1 hypothetical protein GCM10011613_11790 [Cellvibrio zantedeschiae]